MQVRMSPRVSHSPPPDVGGKRKLPPPQRNVSALPLGKRERIDGFPVSAAS